jgi:1A family penicillin-binding protein
MKKGHSWATKKKRSSSRKGPSNKNVFSSAQSTISKFLKKRRGSFYKNIALAGLAALLLGFIIFLGLFAYLSKDLPDPNELIGRNVAQSTKIYDRTGEHLLYEIAGDEKRTLVRLDEIPDYLVEATITAEDRKFYDHNGIDLWGIARAMLKNIIALDVREGASTITQQLVKNAILTDERTITRKVKEIILSLALERRYTKDEIMQLYLNEIAYGSTNYGVQSASLAYFEKPVQDISIAEAATLAALPKQPSNYLNDPESLLARRDWILQNMHDLDYITEDEKNAALLEETPVVLSLNNIDAPHFVLWVKELLEEEFGERMVEQGGLIVTTSLDWDKQIIAEEAIENNREARSEQYDFDNSGLVALDPQSGHILAMVGSTDYFDDEIDGQVNIALRPLQPGSSFKPIIYTSAFEYGYTPNSIVWDSLTTFPTATGPYSPKNYDLQERGSVTLRKALQGSLNIPAVKVLHLVGVQSGIDFAERLHYTTFENRENFGLAIVLGGAEVKLLEHTAAYATFANDGEYREPVPILKVTKPGGSVLFEWKDQSGEQAVEKNIARMITNVLSDDGARAYAFGTGSLLTLPGRPAAAKTGTTNDYKDAWTMGYTPSLAAGVWTGNTRGAAMARGSGGSSVAAPVWNEFMRRALEGTSAEYFTSPNIPQTGKPILDGVIPSQTVTIDTISGKLATDLTPPQYRKTVTCGDFHTILTYVKPSNPLGPEPSEEGRDSHYEAWESGVQDYLVRSNESLEEGEAAQEVCEIPTEDDDVHIASLFPQLIVRAPEQNADIGRTLDVDIFAVGPRGVDRIEYQIDGSVVAVNPYRGADRIFLPSWVTTGSHTLTVTVFDEVDNSDSEDIRIRVTEGASHAALTITNPFDLQTIERGAETYQVVIESAQMGSYISLTLEAQNLWTGASSVVHTTESPEAFTLIDWTLPDPAEYLLVSYAILEGGGRVDAAPVRVIVTDPLAGPDDLILVPPASEEGGE